METIAGTGLFNAGQDCTAATRVLAGAEGVRRRRRAAWPSEAKGYVMGDPPPTDTELGPLISQPQRERVEGFLERTPGNAEVVTGGTEPDLPGLLPRAHRRRRASSRTTR